MNVVLVGISGYAEHYLDMMEDVLPQYDAKLCAVVDPYGRNAPRYSWLQSRKIPLYDTLEDLYACHHADLAVICSPIQYHRQQTITALEQGTAVLCEKPVTPGVADAEAILQVSEQTGKAVGVGFQWSFSPTMRALKEDILSGRLGRPLEMKTHIAWKRPHAYYDPQGWKGKLIDDRGNVVMDSITMNATAHYLHNMLYLLGEKEDEAAVPSWIAGGVFRARDIQSYDTCVIHGAFADGCKMLYCASHVTQNNLNPRFCYRFEKALVNFDENKGPNVTATFTDGTRKVYGQPQSRKEGEFKLRDMLRIVREGGKPVCAIKTALPHLKVCGAIFDKMPVQNFPPERIKQESTPPGVYVQGLDEALLDCYEAGRPVMEEKYSWLDLSTKVML